MPQIIIVVAYQAANRGIGNKGELPWKPIPTDMGRFKDVTLGNTTIMGRNTFWSIPEKYRPLSWRENIIITNTQTPAAFPDEVIVENSLSSAIEKASGEKIFLIGGQGIFEEAMKKNIAHTIMATVIMPTQRLPCDRFFPEINKNHWEIISSTSPTIDEKSRLTLSFLTFKNKHLSFR